MLVSSEMMNINESPSTLMEISIRKALKFTKTSFISRDGFTGGGAGGGCYCS